MTKLNVCGNSTTRVSGSDALAVACKNETATVFEVCEIVFGNSSSGDDGDSSGVGDKGDSGGSMVGWLYRPFLLLSVLFVYTYLRCCC